MFAKNQLRTFILTTILCTVCLVPQQRAFAQLSPTELLKNYVKKNYHRLRVTPAEANDLVITKDYVDMSTGIRHTYATQKLNGLVITNAAFSLHTKKTVQMEANNLVPLSKYAVSPVYTSVRADEAISKVLDAIKNSAPRSLQLKSAPSGTDSYAVYKRNENTTMDVPCRLVYYNEMGVKQLIPAWEIQMMDADQQHFWLAYVELQVGQDLGKKRPDTPL